MKRRIQNSGQALLVVLLTMAVVMTISLSASSQSVVDIKTTSYSEESLRAFSAAEAGIEEVLITETDTGGSPVDIGSDTYATEISSNSVSGSFEHPFRLMSGETAVFWFVGHDDSGELYCDTGVDCVSGTSDLEVCWGVSGAYDETYGGIPDPGEYIMPAIQAILIYDDSGNAIGGSNDFSGVDAYNWVLDPNYGRAGHNKFDHDSVTGCSISSNYEFSFSDTMADHVSPGCGGAEGCYLMLIVRMLYNDDIPQPVAIKISGANLPAQGIQIESTGEAGDASRKVQVFQSYPSPPSIFQNAIFSAGSLSKP